jgi:hypothetical protein
VEVLVQREEAVRLHFPVNSAEFLLNAVDGVEERAAVDAHSAAAEFPVRSQQEVESENLVVELG